MAMGMCQGMNGRGACAKASMAVGHGAKGMAWTFFVATERAAIMFTLRPWHRVVTLPTQIHTAHALPTDRAAGLAAAKACGAQLAGSINAFTWQPNSHARVE